MVTKFSLATNENYRDKNGEWQTKTEWHDIVCWGPLAERVEKNIKKGWSAVNGETASAMDAPVEAEPETKKPAKKKAAKKSTKTAGKTAAESTDTEPPNKKRAAKKKKAK